MQIFIAFLTKPLEHGEAEKENAKKVMDKDIIPFIEVSEITFH